MAQSVPVTLTLSLPSPTGTITIEVPIVMVLDIRIGIGDSITAAVAVTPSQVFTGFEPALYAVRSGASSGASSETGSEADADATPTAAQTATPIPTALPTSAAVGATLTPTPAAGAPDGGDEEADDPTPTPPPPTATPILDTPTPEPTPTPEVAEALPPVCADPGSSITAPGVDQVVSGTVNILGTATHPNFQYFKVEYAPGADVSPSDNFAYLADARTQVQGGVLAVFDSTQFDNGAYTLKLTVVDNTGNFPPPCTVTVIVQN